MSGVELQLKEENVKVVPESDEISKAVEQYGTVDPLLECQF